MVMRGGLGAWQGFAQGNLGSHPMENIEDAVEAGSDGFAPDGTISNDFGAPVVRNLVRTKRPIGVVFTVAEVAERLGVCRATVYAMVERGELAHFRVSNSVRVEERDLRKLLTRRRSIRRAEWR